MNKCSKLEKCPFFNDIMSNMPAESDSIKQQYCLNHFESCARKLVSDMLGSEAVPSDLFPHENYRAVELLNYNSDPSKSELEKQ